jgi:predicted  nucleic acid-binding Zn-ribbon protein
MLADAEMAWLQKQNEALKGDVERLQARSAATGAAPASFLPSEEVNSKVQEVARAAARRITRAEGDAARLRADNASLQEQLSDAREALSVAQERVVDLEVRPPSRSVSMRAARADRVGPLGWLFHLLRMRLIV